MIGSSLEPRPGRVYIRAVTEGDRHEFLQLMRQSQHLHHPWIAPPLTDAAFTGYLARNRRDDHEGLLICQKASDAIAGVVNINNIVRGSFLSASLGYYAGAPHAGQGLMREGLELVKNYAFYTLGLHRLEANIQPDNHRSLALIRQCGFEREGMSPEFLFIDGQWRDHERWTAVHRRPNLRP
ncbi:MAG TPA: GNAT family N-acetyltransferase [Pseudomonadales bacterium]